jgi:hypothetical protein
MSEIKEQATGNVKLNVIDPYSTQERRIGGNLKFDTLEVDPNELDFLTDEELEKSEQAQQNAVLALIVTPRSFEGDIPAPATRVISAYSHASFVRSFNLLSNEEKKESKVLRAYWIGNTNQFPKLRESSNELEVISEYLVQSLAETVRRYKANIPVGKIFTYKRGADQLITDQTEYKEWFRLCKGKTKYEFDIVDKLASGKKVETIYDIAFATKTLVISKEEADKVLELVKTKSEPTLPYRPPSENIADNIAQSLTKLIKEKS